MNFNMKKKVENVRRVGLQHAEVPSIEISQSLLISIRKSTRHNNNYTYYIVGNRVRYRIKFELFSNNCVAISRHNYIGRRSQRWGRVLKIR